MNTIPKFKPRNFQIPILEDFLEYNFRGILSAGRGLGKDFIGLACADALALTKPGSNIAYLGVSLKSVKKILFANEDKSGQPMFKQVMHTECMVKTRNGEYFHKEMSNFVYKNGSMVFVLATDQDQELGTSLDALIITEASRFSFDKWKYLRGNINRADGRILMISTPYFGSEFNDLLDGEHRESMLWNIYKVPSNVAKNFDGSRVYTDERLKNISLEFDEASFRQDYYCDTKAINSESVLGNSLKKANRIDIKELGNYRKMFFSFDLGNSDYTVMFVWYEDENTKIPVLINQMIQRQTNLEDFINKAKEYTRVYGIQDRYVTIVLPFDSDNDLQGYKGKLNRRREIEQNISKEWNISLITKMNIIRMVQVCRMCIETGKVGIAENENGDLSIKALASINYKKDAKTGNLTSDIDKRSGIYEDHPLDSFKYFIAFYFKEMYDEEYDRKIINKTNELNPRLANFNKDNYRISNNFGNSRFGGRDKW